MLPILWRSDTITDFISGVDHLVLSAFGPKPLADGGSLLALNFGHPLAAGDSLYSEASNDDSGTLWYNIYDHTLYAIEGTTSAIDDGSFHTRRTVTSATAIATFSDDSMLQHDSYGHHMLTAQCEAVYCLRKIEMSACPNQHPV